MGGPLIVVPVSALASWGGCTEDGLMAGDATAPDDYDRACAMDDLAGVIPSISTRSDPCTAPTRTRRPAPLASRSSSRDGVSVRPESLPPRRGGGTGMRVEPVEFRVLIS
ncbi:Imm21 family immunity protein [Streptomyces sp. NPDC059556]|uniref:Imm21 family immunity protein n=1 Tax=Streptomyces sp. NPDC059556 TaxID=3346863 RepID=UPI0036C95FD3